MLLIEARPANAWGYICGRDIMTWTWACRLLFVVDGAFAVRSRGPVMACSVEFAATIPDPVRFHHAGHAMEDSDGRTYVPYRQAPLPAFPPRYSGPGAQRW
jgi:hypothetical protein